MSEAVAKLWPAVQALTPNERGELASRLLALIDPGDPDLTHAGWEEAWDEECARRIAAVDRGEMELIPAEEVFRQIDERLAAVRTARP